MKIAVLSSPSTETEEIRQAIIRAVMVPVVVSWDESPQLCQDCVGVVVLDGPQNLSDAMMSLLKQKNALGDPILGVGQGAAVLIETGIVPGVEGNKAALKVMKGPLLEEVIIKTAPHYQFNAFTRLLAGTTSLSALGATEDYIEVPPALLMEMRANGLVVFYYHDSEKIAAVSNKAGNAMAILPTLLASANDLIYQSMHDYLKKGYRQQVKPLYYYPRE